MDESSTATLHHVDWLVDGQIPTDDAEREKVVSHKLWLPLPEEATKPAPGTGALLGHQYQPREINFVCYQVGWRDALDLETIVSIVLAESQGYDHAIHVNLDLSEDRGCFQLSSTHDWIPDDVAYDIYLAAEAAYKLYKSDKNAGRSGFTPWVAWLTTINLRDSYLLRAANGLGNFGFEQLSKLPVEPHDDGTPYERRVTNPALNYQHRLVGCLSHLDKGASDLGWTSASEAKVRSVRAELAKGHTAAKAALPLT